MARKGPMIIVKNRNFEAFRSPINGEVIKSPKHMREHMAQHNVVQSGEFGENNGKAYYERKAKERANIPFSREAKKERINDVMKSIYTLKSQRK